MYIQYVRLHGVPKRILSDRYMLFVSGFLKSFQESTGTKVTFSTYYHPQTDSRTEMTIKTLEDMLRSYAPNFSGNLNGHIPLIEFAITIASTTALECSIQGHVWMKL